MFINQSTENNLNILFGIGLKHIYYDSFLIRLFVSTGIIGIILIILLSLRLEIYLFIFFIISKDLFKTNLLDYRSLSSGSTPLEETA